MYRRDDGVLYQRTRPLREGCEQPLWLGGKMMQWSEWEGETSLLRFADPSPKGGTHEGGTGTSGVIDKKPPGEAKSKSAIGPASYQCEPLNSVTQTTIRGPRSNAEMRLVTIISSLRPKLPSQASPASPASSPASPRPRLQLPLQLPLQFLPSVIPSPVYLGKVGALKGQRRLAARHDPLRV